MATITSTRSPRRDATENRIALLEAAKTVLNADPDASLEAIASAAGLSRRSVYGHFTNRDDLIQTLVTSGAARVSNAVAPVTSDEAPVGIALLAAELWAEVESVRVMAQFAIRGPFRFQIAEALLPLRTSLLEIIKRGIADGSLRQDIDPQTLAHLIEGSALSVLDEATTARLSTERGRELVMLATLGTAGLSWREARELIANHPALTATTSPTDESRA